MNQSKNFLFKNPFILLLFIIGFLLIAFIISFTILYVENQSGIGNINNAIQFSALILSAITIVSLIINYIQQQNIFNRNLYDIEYNRVIDVLYRQLSVDLEKIKELNNIFDVLKNNIISKENLPNVLVHSNLKALAVNLFKITCTFQQFIDRSSLTPVDKSNIFLIYEENLPNDYLIYLLNLESIINNLGNDDKQISKNLKQLFIYFTIKEIGLIDSLSTRKYILQSPLFKKYITDCELAINNFLYVRNIRNRYMDENFQNHMYKFK